MNRQGGWMRGMLLSLAAVASVLVIAGNGSAQGDLDKFALKGDVAKRALTRDEINSDTAEKISHACQDFATQHNIAVSIFIISPSGNIIHAHRMDGQLPNAINTALYKAQSALYMRVSTHELANRANANPAYLRILQYPEINVFPVAGGLPIVVDGQIVGAIGVGGSNMDEQCAYAALTAVLGPQPALTVDPPRPQGAAGQPAPAGQ